MPSGNIKRKQFRTPSWTFLLWDSNTNWHCLTLTSVIIIVTVERVKITLSAGLHNDLTVKTKLKQKWSKARRIWTSIRNEQETQEAATDWWERKVSRHCDVMQARKRAESEGRVARGAQTDPRSIGSQGGTLRQWLSYAHIYGLQLWTAAMATFMDYIYGHREGKPTFSALLQLEINQPFVEMDWFSIASYLWFLASSKNLGTRAFMPQTLGPTFPNT